MWSMEGAILNLKLFWKLIVFETGCNCFWVRDIVRRLENNYNGFEYWVVGCPLQALPEDDREKAMTQTDELTEECLKINYYGAKITVEALLPLLQLSDSLRIVNVSSTMGQLEVGYFTPCVNKFLRFFIKFDWRVNEE